MASNQQRGLAVIGILATVALLGSQIVVGLSINSLASDLADIASYSKTLQADAKTGNLTLISRDLDHLNQVAQKASDSATSPGNTALGKTTAFSGHYVDSIRVLGVVAGEVSGAAQPLAKLLPELKPSSLVTNGAYNLARLKSLSTDVNTLNKTLKFATTELVDIPRAGMDARFVKVLDGVQSAMISASAYITGVAPVLVALPYLIGGTGERTWFVMLQNLAEARGTGGLPGSYVVMKVNQGSVALIDRGSDAKLAENTKAPTKGLPASFVREWGPLLQDWTDFNVSPNFPYAGQLASNAYTKLSGKKVDGVIAIGQGVVQTMVSATGPINVDGNELDSSNIVDFLTNGVYGKYPDKTKKDQVVGDVVAAVFAQLSAGKFSLNGLITGASQNHTDDRIQAWSSLPADQSQFVFAGIAGVLPDSSGPTVAVTVNNRGGNKLDQFLHVKADYALGICTSQIARPSDLKVTVTNAAPTSGLPAYVTPRNDPGSHPIVGSNLELVTVYAPVGALQKKFSLDGKFAFYQPGTERNHPYYSFYVELNPGQTRVLDLTWTEPVKSGVNSGTVITQPMLNPVVVKTPAAPRCTH
jgi:hypothetical protein